MSPATPCPLRSRRLSGPAALGLLTAAALAGCGGSGSENADPAKLVPKGAGVYFVASVRASGEQKAGVDSVARKLGAGGDPGSQIEKLIDRELNQNRHGGSRLSYRDDVKPWLGKRVAVFVPALQPGGRTDAGFVVTTKDSSRARDAIRKIETGSGGPVVHRSFRGVDYDLQDTTAAGTVDGFLVVGTEGASRGTVDVSKGSVQPLTGAPAYRTAERRGQGKLAFGYANFKGFVDAALTRLPPDQRSALIGSLGSGSNPAPLTVALDVRPKLVSVDFTGPGGGLGVQGGQTPLLAGLPGDSWLALGIPRLGQSLSTFFQRIGSGLGGAATSQLQTLLAQRTGLDLQRDVFAAIGDVALFARGTSLLTVGGGALIQSPDPAAARRLVDKLGSLIRRRGGPGHACDAGRRRRRARRQGDGPALPRRGQPRGQGQPPGHRLRATTRPPRP